MAPCRSSENRRSVKFLRSENRSRPCIPAWLCSFHLGNQQDLLSNREGGCPAGMVSTCAVAINSNGAAPIDATLMSSLTLRGARNQTGGDAFFGETLRPENIFQRYAITLSSLQR
jgi:hypothetical protein